MGVMNADGYDQALAQRLLERNTPSSVLRERIRQLEAQCATLAAEVDRMRPVVEAAQGWAHGGASKWLPILAMTINDYEASRPK